MKLLIEKINTLSGLLKEMVAIGNIDNIITTLDERFELLKQLLKIDGSENYISNLLENDKLILIRIEDEQRKIKMTLDNMDKLSNYRM